MDNKLKIVSYLAKNQDRLFTMHELSKLVDIPYASFYRTIFKMKDILEIKNLGKSKIVQLYTANRIIQAYLSIALAYLLVPNELEKEDLEILKQSHKIFEEEYVHSFQDAQKESHIARYSAIKTYTERRLEEIFENARKFVAKIILLLED